MLSRRCVTLALGALAALPAVAAAAGAVPSAAPTVQLSERDGLADVYSWQSIAPPFRPEIDLLAAGIAQERNELRLRIVTAAPARDARFAFSGSEREECGDFQLHLEIVVGPDGAVTVLATDRGNRRARRIPTAEVTRAGNELELRLPLLATPTMGSWMIASSTPSRTTGEIDEWLAFGDTIPDWEITGAYFTRGTGTPNYPPMCGPADPPLLPR